MDDPRSTGDRMVRAESAALELAEVVEDLARDMETIVINLPDRTKRTHEYAQTERAKRFARALRAAVDESRGPWEP
jgi:RNase H-fold protein (predicted Holliday junction resolvase)